MIKLYACIVNSFGFSGSKQLFCFANFMILWGSIFLLADDVVLPKKMVDVSKYPLSGELLREEQKRKGCSERKMVKDIVSKVVSGDDSMVDRRAEKFVCDKERLNGVLSDKIKMQPLEGSTRHLLNEQFKDKSLAGKKISLSLKNVRIEDAIELVGKMANLNFVVDSDVEGVIKNVNLKGVPVAFALKILFSNNHPELALIKEFNIFRVMRFQKATEVLKSKFENIAENNFERAVVTLNHIKVNESLKLRIEKMWQSIIGDAAGRRAHYLVCDDTSKKIFFRGRQENVAEMKTFLKNIDIHFPQIKIEVRIVIANKDFEESLGFRWSGIYNRRASIKRGWGFVGAGPLENIKNNPTAQILSSLMDWALNFFPDSGEDGRSIHIPFVFGGSDLNTKRLNLVLNAAENRDELKTILKPSILTNHGEEAEILVGASIPIETIVKETIEGSLRDVTTASYKDVGTKLRVKPLILPNKNSIFLDIFVENSTYATIGSNKYPTITTTRSRNRVALRNGQTTMIGGLIEDTKSNSKSSVPIVSQIPLLGLLFKGSRKEIKDHQLLIFITPTMV